MPVRWRLTIFNALAIGAILVALGLALFLVLRATLLSSVEETAQSRAFAAARSIAAGEGLEEEEGRLVLDDDLVDGRVHHRSGRQGQRHSPDPGPARRPRGARRGMARSAGG